MEAVIFVGGVSLGQPATAIPIAAIVGIVCGLVVGYIIYTFASRAGGKLLALIRSITHTQASFEGFHGCNDKLHSPYWIWTLQQSYLVDSDISLQ